MQIYLSSICLSADFNPTVNLLASSFHWQTETVKSPYKLAERNTSRETWKAITCLIFPVKRLRSKLRN